MTPDSAYKAEKKASVTDLQGGGIWEINILTLMAPVCPPLLTIDHVGAGV